VPKTLVGVSSQHAAIFLPEFIDNNAANDAIRPLADLLPTGLAIFDANGDCRYANPRAAELFGTRPEGLLGRGWWRAVQPEDLASVDEAWQRARVSREPYERRLRFSTGDGERWVLIRVTAAPDGGWVVAIDDHTEEVLARRAMAEREAEFRLLAENSTDVIARLDANAVYTYVSPASLRVFGYAPEELVGRSSLALMHPEDAAKLVAAGPAESDEPITYTFRLRHREGHWTWIESNTVAKFDPLTREIVEFHGTSRCVDDRMRAEAGRQSSDARFRSAFEDAPIGMAITDLTGQMVRVNRAMCSLLGYDAEAFANLRWPDITHPDDLAGSREQLFKMIAGETESARFEKRYVHSNGGIVEADVSVSLVRDADGTPLHFVAQLFDLRERNRAQRDSDALKNEFFALVSHELRTPLTSISGYIDMLLDGEDDGDPAMRERFLRIAERNTIRLQRLVGDILFAAQIEAGELPLERGRSDLTATCREAVEAAKPRAADLGLELHADVDEMGIVEGDHDRLAQTVDNLISNALKFTPAGGTVSLRASRSDGAFRIEVEDTGIGITPEAQTQLFDRFYRAPDASDVAGIGLGLTITKAIIEAHDGTVAVESEPGKGSTFRITLPLSRQRA
jgi:PAS domain S-box-containing protein